MTIPWEILIPIIIDLIAGCFDDETNQRERIRNPRGLVLMRLGAAVRKENGWDRAAWRQNRSNVYRAIRMEAAQLSDEEIDELILEARDVG